MIAEIGKNYKGIILISFFMGIIMMLNGFQMTFLIQENKEIKEASTKLLAINQELLQDNNELRTEIEALQVMTRDMVRVDANILMAFNQAMVSYEEIKMRTADLEAVLYEKKK